jgi:hypothetical protein
VSPEDLKILLATVAKVLRGSGVVVDARSIMKNLDEERAGREAGGNKRLANVLARPQADGTDETALRTEPCRVDIDVLACIVFLEVRLCLVPSAEAESWAPTSARIAHEMPKAT